MKSSLRFVLCWVCLCLSFGVAQADDSASGFKSIFDGKTLEGWEGDANFWSVEDGAITGRTTPENPTKGNTFVIWRAGKTGDFELRLKYRIVGGNSGIQYRSEEVSEYVIKGYQADIDSTFKFSGILYEEKGRGILAHRGKKVSVNAEGKPENTGETTSEKKILDDIKKEDWNNYRIVAKGNHLIHEINGNVTVEVVDHDEKHRKMSGLLALQLHAGPPMTVQFKDIQLKELGEKKK